MTDWRGEVGIQPWLEALSGESLCQTLRMREIAEQICETYGLTLAELRGPSPLRIYAFPRFEFYYRAMQETHHSTVAIGRWCGGRDHTSVLHGCDRYALMNNLAPARGRVPRSRVYEKKGKRRALARAVDANVI